MKRQLICTISIALCSGILLLMASCSRQAADTFNQNGEPIRLSDYRGQWVVVNYWASWCVPCMQEIAELNKFYNKHHSHGVAVFGVSYDPLTNEQISQFRKLYKVQYPMMQRFPLLRFGVKSVDVVPTTLIIDPTGHLYKQLFGPQTLTSLDAVIHSYGTRH